MADLTSFIFNQSDPNVNQQLRQRIALAMLSKQRKYPKTFGEGLSAIGDALGDIGMARRLEQADLDQQNAAKAGLPPATSAEAAPSTSTTTMPKPVQMAAADDNTADDAAAPPSRNTGIQESAPSSLTTPIKPVPKLSDVPTGAEGDTGATTFPPPYQPKPAFSPSSPTQTPDDPRRATALAMLKQGNLGQPQSPAFMPAPMAGPQAEEDPRRAIALSMLKQGNLGQPQNANFAPSSAAPPVAAAGPQPTPMDAMAFSGAPAPAAPPMPAPAAPPMAAAPEQQIRQAPPGPVRIPVSDAAPAPGYVMQAPPEPVAPKPLPMTPRETQIIKAIESNPNNEYYTKLYGGELARLQKDRTDADTRNVEKYKQDLEQHRMMMLKREDQRQQAPGDIDRSRTSQLEQKKMADEARVRAQMGNMDPKQVFEVMKESTADAKQARVALLSADQARKAIENGAITGIGANQRLDMAKLLHGLGLKSSNSDIVNTETFKSYMQPLVAAAIKQSVGSTNISDQDRRFAQDAVAGNITLDGDSIKRVIDFVGRASRETLDTHSTRVNTLFGDSPQGKALFHVEAPPIERGKSLIPSFSDEAAAQAAKLPKGTRVLINGRMGTVQ